MAYQQVMLVLTHPQISKLQAGKPIQIPKDQLQIDRSHHLYMHPENCKKIDKARSLHKGVRIQMTADEIAANGGGEGLREIVAGLRKAGRFVKDKVIDTPTYQKHIRPLVRKGVDLGIKSLAPYTGVATPLVQRAADEVGKRTGAFGLRGGRPKRKAVKMPAYNAHEQHESGEWEAPEYGAGKQFLGTYNPNMWPVMASLPDIGSPQPTGIPFPQDSMPRRKKRVTRRGTRGGSFKVAGA